MSTGTNALTYTNKKTNKYKGASVVSICELYERNLKGQRRPFVGNVVVERRRHAAWQLGEGSGALLLLN